MARRRGGTYAEQRERRRAVDDPELVLAAGLRFLEARARSVAEVRRRLTQGGYQPALVDGAMGDGCTLVNPREPTEEDFAQLYEKAL